MMPPSRSLITSRTWRIAINAHAIKVATMSVMGLNALGLHAERAVSVN